MVYSMRSSKMLICVVFAGISDKCTSNMVVQKIMKTLFWSPPDALVNFEWADCNVCFTWLDEISILE